MMQSIDDEMMDTKSTFSQRIYLSNAKAAITLKNLTPSVRQWKSSVSDVLYALVM